jgi:hypothetical protein
MDDGVFLFLIKGSLLTMKEEDLYRKHELYTIAFDYLRGKSCVPVNIAIFFFRKKKVCNVI